MAKFFKTTIIGDRAVEARMLTYSRVVENALTSRFHRLSKALDAARQATIPKETGRAASSLFSRVEVHRAPDRSVVLEAGFRDEVASYVDFLDYGSGVHHIPDPHPPWFEYTHVGERRMLAFVAPGTHAGGTMGGFLEKFIQPHRRPVLHYGARPSRFTERALETIRPVIAAEMRTAGPEIARKMNG